MRFFVIASIFFAAAVSVFASPIVQRDNLQSVSAILTDLQAKVEPLANQLRSATRESATEAELKPVIGQMSTSVTDAVSNLKLLSGQPSTVILASIDGEATLDPSDIANLLCAIVILVLDAVHAVLQVVDSAIYALIYDLLVALVKVAFGLIPVVLSLVAGLLAPLLVLLLPVLSIVSELGLTAVLGGILGGVL